MSKDWRCMFGGRTLGRRRRVRTQQLGVLCVAARARPPLDAHVNKMECIQVLASCLFLSCAYKLCTIAAYQCSNIDGAA
jgi:hypothetical protein